MGWVRMLVAWRKAYTGAWGLAAGDGVGGWWQEMDNLIVGQRDLLGNCPIPLAGEGEYIRPVGHERTGNRDSVQALLV